MRLWCTLTVLIAASAWASGSSQHLHPPVEIEPLPAPPKVTTPSVAPSEMASFVDKAVAAMADRFDRLEQEIAKKGVVQTPGSSAWFMGSSHATNGRSRNLTHIALVAEEATRYIAQALKLSHEQINFGLPVLDVRETALGRGCPLSVDFPCQPRKYRAYSGYCNNVQNPRWGNAETRYLRFLPPAYDDGTSLPRGQRSDLPSPRAVSLGVHTDKDAPHPHLMSLAPAWAEMVAHDLAHTTHMTGFEGSRLKCCSVGFSEFHPECFPIRIPEQDPVYGQTGEKCQEYTRSGSSPRTGCTLGPREQLNQATSFLDGSAIYGNSREKADSLRTFSRGTLKSQSLSSGELILPSDERNEDCRKNATFRCFSSGDVRANEHESLAALHTLFLRQHNRLAALLAHLNPHWGDETLFQEARRIVVAQLQHITYNEFLPVVLGQSVIDRYGLRLQTSDHFTGYDININAGLANSVASAALWFVASLMPKSQGEDSSYAPFALYTRGGVDLVLNSLLHGAAQRQDNHINELMTGHMFQEPGKDSGLDLAAQIIQQGRDHGLPGYTRWRQFCGFPHVKTFADLSHLISDEVIAALKKVYRDVKDIDLFTGALSERLNEGTVVGPTFGCLLGRQFHYTRRGDRYWYENDLPPSSFSKDQLNEIRKSTLSRLICDNSDIDRVQPSAFLDNDPFLNAMMECSGKTMGHMELGPWVTRNPQVKVPTKMLAEAIARAQDQVARIMRQEKDLHANHRNADPQSPIGTAFGFNRPKRQAALIANTSIMLQFASMTFVNSFLQGDLKDDETGLAPRFLRELMSALPDVDLSDAVDIPRVFPCDEQTLPCDHTSRYRSATGWCNNLKRPEMGKAFRAFVRLLPPDYQDGVGSPRSLSKTGAPLPSARSISVNVHPDSSHPHTRYSMMFMQFAQLIDHDLTHTPVNKGFVGESILDCAPCDAMTSVHPECIPIKVPDNDPYFPRVNITTGLPTCIPVTRSMPGQLTLGYREQLNQVTAYLDASFVYGSDVCAMKLLRSAERGRMNVTRQSGRGKDLMPEIDTHPECKSRSKVCFRGGDARASEQPGLAALHTIFLREHNRVALRLATINSHWPEEKVYQTARRIVSATTQHMAFSEFLPRLLGWQGLHHHGLSINTDGYFNGYDDSCDATIVNEFAAAAFRFGHSLLKPSLVRMDSTYTALGGVRLRDTFFNPVDLYTPGMVDELIRGLIGTPMETLDEFITKEVTNHLFEDKKTPYSGMDLAAINIQRGRDHGLPGYNEYRVICNLTRAQSFSDLSVEIPEKTVKRLQTLYAHVDDIDLFPGGLAETPLPGGVVGPTFACIIGHQFRLLRKCDRFWYENSDPLVRFTEAQLSSLRRATLARLVCDNGDDIRSVQRSLLDQVDPFLNPRVACKALPSIELDLWQERRTCAVGRTSIDVGAAGRISPCVMCTCTTEGPICQSLRIGNCFTLATKFSATAILDDHVCKVQCAFVFRALPRLVHDDNQLGFS